MGNVRRSNRTRKTTYTVYDDAKAQRDSIDSTESRKKRRLTVDDDSVDEDAESRTALSVAAEPEDVSDNDNDNDNVESSSDEEEADAGPPQESGTTKYSSRSRATSSQPRQIRAHRAVAKPSTKRRGGAASMAAITTTSRRAAQTVLQGLAGKVLDPVVETPETSLLAALLQQAHDNPTHRRSGGSSTPIETNLQRIALTVLHEHDTHPNRAQISLLNLLFRSVGGGVHTLLDPEEVDLESLSDEAWEDLVTKVLVDMQQTPADLVLFCADPNGTGGKKASVGVREYRKVYRAFWNVLGATALTMTTRTKSLATDAARDHDSDTDEESFDASARFQVELVRDMVGRVVEIVGVGQPDIRAAASVAIYSLSIAVLSHTVTLRTKLEAAQRQLATAQRSKQKRKAHALQAQITIWTRTTEDLEDIVKETTMGVFLKRYRDSNPHIRAESLHVLSRFTLTRPDIFHKATFLKYLGWMLSDKEAVVRERALDGLMEPLLVAPTTSGKPLFSKIDVSDMRSVVDKFATRLADCVLDVDTNVQEKAMNFLLNLSRQGLLDSLEDDQVWEQINLRALAEDATPIVRRDALFFVTEQLEAFDSGSTKLESNVTERIHELVVWVAHSLADGNIPLEHIRFDLVGFIVVSLRASPELKPIICNWPVLLKGLQRDKSSTPKSKHDRRMLAVQQRVLLEMLIRSVELEVRAVAKDGLMVQHVDPDLLAVQESEDTNLLPSRKKSKGDSSHEELTVALLRALPDLLDLFKTDSSVLELLTGLPPYFLPSVFNLPNRKQDFCTLISKLSKTFLEATDSNVLFNCALALSCLAKDDHARSGDAFLELQATTTAIQVRLSKLFERKADILTSDSPKGDNLIDTEHAIGLCLRRLRILSKRWDIADLLVDGKTKANSVAELEKLCIDIVRVVANDLRIREVKNTDEVDNNKTPDIPKVWLDQDKRVHSLVAESASEALSFLLSATAWRLKIEVDDLAISAEAPKKSNGPEIVVRMRDSLIKLVVLCFEQYVELDEGNSVYSEEHFAFAEKVQSHAGTIAGDLRSLFPKQWSAAVSPKLRSFALTEDGHVVGGFVRFLKSQEHRLRANEKMNVEDRFAIEQLLLPIARGLSANWKDGIRREAGAVLSHITGSGRIARSTVSSLSRVLKRIEPVRFLEAHMACLRQDFDDWAASEPEELESDHPTEKEMVAYDEKEKEHAAKFDMIEQQAQRLSASLGVGKLREKSLGPALLGFVREGARVAFSTDVPGYEEELPLGARLPFLRIVSKYLNWIRRNENQLQTLRQDFNEMEKKLRSESEYNDIYEDDLATIEEFRRAGDLGKYPFNKNAKTDTMDDGSFSAESLDSRTRPRMSITSNISSIRSKMSATQASLSPLYEEGDGDRDSDDVGDDAHGSTNDYASTHASTHASNRFESESVSTRSSLTSHP